MAKSNVELTSASKPIKILRAKQSSMEQSTPPRVSPLERIVTPTGTTPPRTSPGLLAGHYASCKFTEPPSPSALPLPPLHWMQTTRVVLPLRSCSSVEEPEKLVRELKILLKVQA